MKINVLGTEYKVCTVSANCLPVNDGVCCIYEKKINVRLPAEMLEKETPEEAKLDRYREVLRHEIIHAFLFESGLDDLGSNEELVDWIAKQFPKMTKAFEEAGCM